MKPSQRLTDSEVVALAENMNDHERLRLIEEIAAIGTPQSQTIARWLMDLHLAEKAKTRTIH
jgi:hypothetical protein